MATTYVDTWQCPGCGVRNNGDLCICRRVRPMTTKGFPQIFSGMVFHFNGIIPRTLKHPSHAIEWRMAEAHGAVVLTEMLPTVTHLVYRPGYERSEKVRKTFEFPRIASMPIKWMLDSMLQARQLHESLYRLDYIPEAALPTSNSTVLQHRNHAYFVQNWELFVPPGVQVDASVGSAAQQLMSSAAMVRAQRAVKTEAPPKLDPIPALVARTKGSVLVEKPGPGARSLLRGSVLAFANEDMAVEGEAPVAAHGGAAIPFGGDLTTATHIVFNASDKKSDAMIDAYIENQRRIEEGAAPILMVNSNWLLDAMYLEALPPALGPYIASDKLVATLAKKAAKRGA